MVIGNHQRLRRLAAGFSVSWLVFAFMVLIDRPFIQVNAYTVVKSSFKRSLTSNRSCRFRPRLVKLKEETKSCGSSYVLRLTQSFSALLKFSQSQAKFLLSFCVNV